MDGNHFRSDGLKYNKLAITWWDLWTKRPCLEIMWGKKIIVSLG